MDIGQSARMWCRHSLTGATFEPQPQPSSLASPAQPQRQQASATLASATGFSGRKQRSDSGSKQGRRPVD